MKICIFGGQGMAGHMIQEYLTQNTDWEVYSTIRGKSSDPTIYSLNVIDHIQVLSLLEHMKPDIVINAVGILNDQAMKKRKEAIYVNSLFPHILEGYSKKLGYRLIHISTDCVFSGRRGNYQENDTTDGTTIYAKTKALGEVISDHHVTIRTSIIGPELKQDGIGLFHWFMQQEQDLLGYRQVYWSGVTTLELAKAIHWTIQSKISGLVHLTSPNKITKFSLLQLLKEVYERDSLTIHAFDGIHSDKSLVCTRKDFTFQVQPYPYMLEELKKWMDNRSDLYSFY